MRRFRLKDRQLKPQALAKGGDGDTTYRFWSIIALQESLLVVSGSVPLLRPIVFYSDRQ